MSNQIFEIDPGYLIEMDDCIFGHFKDLKAVRYAFEFSAQELEELTALINPRGLTRGITFEMLRKKKIRDELII